jgi:hypothetical protein
MKTMEVLLPSFSKKLNPFEFNQKNIVLQLHFFKGNFIFLGVANFKYPKQFNNLGRNRGYDISFFTAHRLRHDQTNRTNSEVG